jgi:tetratricopeptide (TPR) repeat protein
MTLALVVIARDEAPRIQRLLHSVAPWVDDMLVLDTGSRDDTAQRALACGARVAHQAWRDDFAAARNAALTQSSADWHLVLDADEWLVEGGPALRALAALPADFVGALRLDDIDTPGGVVHSWLSRLLPGHVRYSGRVHEQPQHRLPVKRVPLVVGHDGYSPVRLAIKQGRNRRLLLAELDHAPDDAYLWYQLGKDHAAYGEHPQAADAFAHAAAGPAAPAAAEPWHTDLTTCTLYALKKAGRHEEAMALADQTLQACGESPDFFFALGDLLLDMAVERPGEVDRLLPMAQAAWQRCLEIGERPDLHGSVAGRGSHLAAHNLAVVCSGLGMTDEAAHWRARYPSPHARPG